MTALKMADESVLRFAKLRANWTDDLDSRGVVSSSTNSMFAIYSVSQIMKQNVPLYV
jgi:hypothetical protein